MNPSNTESGPSHTVRAAGALGARRDDTRIAVELVHRPDGVAAVLLDLEERSERALAEARACALAHLSTGAHILETFRAVDAAVGRGDRPASVVVVAIDSARGEVSMMARGGTLVVVPPTREPATLVTAFRAGAPPLRVHAFGRGAALLAATAGLAEDTTGVLALAARLELPRIDPALLEPGNPRLGAAVADHVRSARSVARQSAVLVAASLETDLLGPQGPTARGREP